MTHITKEQIECGASAKVGDTFTRDNESYKATKVESLIGHPCTGCEFERRADSGMVRCAFDSTEIPDCIKHDVIYVHVRAE